MFFAYNTFRVALASDSKLTSLSPKEANSRQTDRSSSDGGSGVEPVRIRRARAFIRDHIGEPLSLRQVAKVADTSANYLSEKFKEATGTNSVRYVAQTRYEKAATLLRETDLRVSEIAFAVGFQSLSQFNRVFRKLSGTSPSGYRLAMCAGRNASQGDSMLPRSISKRRRKSPENLIRLPQATISKSLILQLPTPAPRQ